MRIHKLFLALIVVLALAAHGRPASADVAAGCQGSLANPSLIVIDCLPGYATDHDRIEVHLRQPAAPGAAWNAALDYADAIWVYRIGQGERTGLVVDFQREGDQVSAQLYDDQNGDATVSFAINGGRLELGEPVNRPTVRATAGGGWWLPDGTVNYNLDLTVNGRVHVMLQTLYLDLLKTDAVDDYTIHVRDPNQNGHPDYEWRQAYPPLADEDGFYHSSVMHNTKDDEPPIEGSLFWPFLGSGDYREVKDYQESPPPIHMDWATAKLDLISEFVASRAIPHNYFVYTIRRIKEGQLNLVNFESPFAFYNLGGPDPMYPNLTIRTVYYPKGDVHRDMTVEQIDVTWRHNDSSKLVSPNWDYRLGLQGRHEHQGQVDFKEFSLAITPYDKLPGWVMGNTWDYATFVARERPEYFTSEHIYEWSTLEGVVIDHSVAVTATERVNLQSIELMPDYVRGAYVGDIRQFYRSIGVGLRGELSADFNSQPYVYVSAVDRKMHLLKAIQGVWTLGAGETITYANLDDDDYLDQWRYQRLPAAGSAPGRALTETRELNIAPGHLVYGDDRRVILRAAAVKPALVQALPPTTPEEWERWGEQLEQYAPTLAADDLIGMLRQFPGSETVLEGARLSHYRPLGAGGFRFVLTVLPGAAVRGAPLAGLDGLAPGEYVVTYDGGYRLEPLTPPQFSGALTAPPLRPLEINPITISAANTGRMDAAGTRLELWAGRPGAAPTRVTSQSLDLLAGVPVTATLQWAPPSGGAWALSARIVAAGGEPQTLASAELVADQTAAADSQALLLTSSTQSGLPFSVFVLLMFMLLAGLACWHYWRLPSAEQVDDGV